MFISGLFIVLWMLGRFSYKGCLALVDCCLQPQVFCLLCPSMLFIIQTTYSVARSIHCFVAHMYFGIGYLEYMHVFLKLLFLARKYTHTHITVFNQSHMCDKLKRCFMVRDGVARIVSRVAEVTCTATPLPGSKHCHGNQTSVRKSANIKVSLPEREWIL